MDKLDFIKIKNICFIKDIIKRKKRQVTNWKIFSNLMFNKMTCIQNNKEISELKSKKTNKLIKTWAKLLNRHFTKEYKQMANKHMKDIQHHFH